MCIWAAHTPIIDPKQEVVPAKEAVLIFNAPSSLIIATATITSLLVTATMVVPCSSYPGYFEVAIPVLNVPSSLVTAMEALTIRTVSPVPPAPHGSSLFI